jgi:phenylacetate-CoA ligase
VFTDVDDQLRWLRELRPTFLYTLPSNLGALLDRIEESGSPPPNIRRVFCGGEVVHDALRRRSRTTLDSDIADNYGSTEAFLAWQCRSGGYHINAEHVILEVVDDAGRPVPPGALGRVLVTTLDNRLCPLIRYEIGDFAEPAQGRCSCGRTLPLLARAAGRSVNLFRLGDGRLLSPWALVVRLKFDDAFAQFQIVQQTEDRFLVRYVATTNVTADAKARIRTAFDDVIGTRIRVSFERVDEIPRTPTGKFMTAISELAPDRGSGE